MTTSLSVLLASESASSRGARVYPRLPAWLVEAVNKSYGPEVLAIFGRRLRNVDDVEDFLRAVAGRCKPFDHRGSDADQNFVSEPYARDCAACRHAAETFSLRLGTRLTVTTPTWHAPGSDKCIRFTFFKPEVRR